MAKLSASSGRKSSEQQRRANAEDSRSVRRPAFPKLSSTGQLFSGTSTATTTPTLTNTTTSPSNGGFSPASVQSPMFSTMRPKTAGAEGGTGVSFKTHLQRQQWADMMMTGSPIEVVAEDDTYMFPTPLRRPSTAANSAAASPALSEEPFAFLKKGNFSPALGSAPIAEESGGKSWPPLRAPGMKPVRAHTTNDWSTDRIAEKPKLNRWKSLGGLFGKKKAESGTLEAVRSPTTIKEEQIVTKVDSPIKEESPKEQSPTSPAVGLLRSFTKRNKTLEKRPKTRDGKVENKAEQTTLNPPLNPPMLDVEIPEITMERYSVMFKEIRALPARSSSLSSKLLARRQASVDTKTHLVPGGSLKALDITPQHRLGHVRSATEPSPRSPRTPNGISHRLIPEEDDDPNRELPHISALLHRPRPIKRTKTAPPTLPSVNPRDQKLSPTFESDELEYDDRDRLTPTPPDPSPPTTPKSPPRETNLLQPNKELRPIEQNQRKNSWDTSTNHSNDSAYEIITIGKRISENDMVPATTMVPATNLVRTQRKPSRARPPRVTPIKPPVVSSNSVKRSNSNKPRLETAVPPRLETAVPPRMEVAVARTLSLKRANSGKATIVRSTSVKSVRNKENSAINSSSSTPRIVMTEPTSIVTTPVEPIPTFTFSEPPKEQSRPLLQSSYSIVNQPQPGALSRKESTRLEIKKEIWGERKLKVEEVRDTNAALVPQMCVVGEEESRRSVWGMIETA